MTGFHRGAVYLYLKLIRKNGILLEKEKISWGWFFGEKDKHPVEAAGDCVIPYSAFGTGDFFLRDYIDIWICNK